ncbi:hypothetical protein DFQ30_011307 [Apophysomyces sp. BC1015]|nr:hypothetical protein DFQ30_011307 [Apophysomyces sp. BC1015]
MNVTGVKRSNPDDVSDDRPNKLPARYPMQPMPIAVNHRIQDISSPPGRRLPKSNDLDDVRHLTLNIKINGGDGVIPSGEVQKAPRQDMASEQSDHLDNNPYENLYERIRQGKCRNYVKSEIGFDGKVSDELKQATRVAIDAIGPIFPPGFDRVQIKQMKIYEDVKGTTLTCEGGRSAFVKINADDSFPKAVPIGLYAHSIDHEVFLHAQSQMEAASFNMPAKSEFDDPMHTYAPRNRDNRYLDAMHRVFDLLPGVKAKQSFAHAVQEDIRAQSDNDEDLAQSEFDEIDLWSSARRNSMDDAIDNRYLPDWGKKD